MRDQEDSGFSNKRATDIIKTWVSIVGPVLGIAFGVGIYKASTQGQLDKIPKLEARMDELEQKSITDRIDIQVTETKFTEQIAAINNRMGRMEDLLEKTFYSVSEIPKDQRRRN